MRRHWFSCVMVLGFGLGGSLASAAEPRPVDFNREIRPILSNTCFQCHGPDEAERKGGTDGLRLDTEKGAFEDLGGYSVLVRGKPDESELIRRITSTDAEEIMPPPSLGKPLKPAEIELLKRWVKEGAKFATHWSYVKPERPPVPQVKLTSWPKNDVDRFLLSRLENEGLTPSPKADRYTLIRRLSLDLTGLPPSLEEVNEFLIDQHPDAYERLVDRMLAKDTYGEHWARMWLDLARYADSAGYADDPPRTIWAFRDYVIRSLNQNKPFDQFTIEQIAGDLLPNPTEDQLIATAFHRNTLTNNEGGTNDEEFRNVAIVDRVNTTMAVWMGTTMACAQCHSHKFDPITQEEYFRFFAIFNNTQDADTRNESPLLTIFTPDQFQQKAAWEKEITSLETRLKTFTPELKTAQAKWETRLSQPMNWQSVVPSEAVTESKQPTTVSKDGTVLVPASQAMDTYKLQFPFAKEATLSAIQLETLPNETLPNNGPGHAKGAFVISQITAQIVPAEGAALSGRFVRVEIPGDQKILSLAEVQVFANGKNIATSGTATQSSSRFDGPPKLAIDGNTNGDYFTAKSTTHTATESNPWWQLDLGSTKDLERIVLWNRTDGNVGVRLNNFRLSVLDENKKPVWEKTVKVVPTPSSTFSMRDIRQVKFAQASADFEQPGFSANNVIQPAKGKPTGWAVSPQLGKAHQLTLFPESPLKIKAGSKLVVAIEQKSQLKNHTLGAFRIQVTEDQRASEMARVPKTALALLQIPLEKRTPEQQTELSQAFLATAKELEPDRNKLAGLKKQLADQKPATTVPIQRELAMDKRRVTKIQMRGDFLITGKTVTEGVPSVFPPIPKDAPPNRLTLAHWLVDEENPLTARVMANRYWEKIFGIGLVETSEEFGSQGDQPTHPELLDWLATELVQNGWDMKALIKLLVTTSAYQQTARVTPRLLELDPDNRLLARGPRFRMSAEMIRDQALFVSGLLSEKMYGPPVKPPQPKLGVSAAFGSGIDWTTSMGADKFRRGLYTMWRRSNPYPSMATFDAPNREVCTLRRDRTNTPLQALVTLNDPVYVEAAQSLGRRMAGHPGTLPEKIQHGFQLCVTRPPHPKEAERLLALYQLALKRFQANPAQALKMATEPLGALPKNANPPEYAAWSLVGNVLLNLDEMFMRR